MRDEHQRSPKPSSRRPLVQDEQARRPFVEQETALSSSQQPVSSQIWTPSQSFTSHSSQELDPAHPLPSMDPRASFQRELDQTFSRHRPQISSISSYRSEGPEASSSPTQPVQQEVPYSAALLPEVQGMQGPPLPYPYQFPSTSPELYSTRSEARRPSAELHPRGHSYVPRSRARRTSAVEPYLPRRPSMEARAHSFDPHVLEPQRHPPSSPSRPPSQPLPLRSPLLTTSESFQYPSGTGFESYSTERTPPMRMSPTTSRSQTFPTRLPPYSPVPAPAPPFPRSYGPAGPVHSGSESPFSRAPTPTYPPLGPRPLPNLGELSTIPSSYSLGPPPPPPPPPPLPPSPPAPPRPMQLSPRQRRRHHTQPESLPVTSPIHYTRASRRPHPAASPANRRRRPPEPYSSYANMLADIIGNHRRRKMTLQELYEDLKERYGDHFPDDGLDDKGNGSGGWRNTVRHALSVNKWFKKQYRTDADAKLDEMNPDHVDPEPIDLDRDEVAPPTKRAPQGGGQFQGGMRPLKGGYWFIREKYREAAAEAIRRDKERYAQTRQELLEEERRAHYGLRIHSRQPSPPPAPAGALTMSVQPRPSGHHPPYGYDPHIGAEAERTPPYGRGGSMPHHYLRYPRPPSQ